ncbi:hypothetical protein [Micromonospora sp. RTP1Z1]|uniref:hypothetical protein n=1 Tax=Micromonospora sp. RTP1Z1 TaxID=2994043 RepID=UPI0029C9A980|nr:hypothetical protein [Micromonospora sp. RTP1Z1]
MSGPFRHWYHEHLFTADPRNASATVMRDVIEFTAPAEAVGGTVSRLVLLPYLRRLVAGRNAFLAEAVAASGATAHAGATCPHRGLDPQQQSADRSVSAPAGCRGMRKGRRA